MVFNQACASYYVLTEFSCIYIFDVYFLIVTFFFFLPNITDISNGDLTLLFALYPQSLHFSIIMV